MASSAALSAATALDAAVATALSRSRDELSGCDIHALLRPLDAWEEATRNSILGESVELLAKYDGNGMHRSRLLQAKNEVGIHAFVPDTSDVVTIPSVVALPPAGNYVSSVQSTKVADDTVLRHLPYFGDNDAIGVDLEMYDNGATLAVLEVASGSDDFLLETLARHAVMNLSSATQDAHAQAKLEAVLAGVSDELGHTLEWMKNRFEEAVDKFKRRQQLQHQAAGPRIIRQSTFSALLCRRCFIYDCSMHGSMHAVAPLHINEKHKELRCTLQQQRHEFEKHLKQRPNAGVRLSRYDISAPSGADGETLVPSRDKDYLYAPDTLERILMISEGDDSATVSLGNLLEKDLPLIKQIIDRKITQECASTSAGADAIDGEAEHSARGKGAGRGKKRRRGQWEHRKIAQSKKRDESDKVMFYNEYIPCNHVDSCSDPAAPESGDHGDASSSLRECCVESGFRCEKFCICPVSCPKRWPGCNCTTGCRTGLCPCVQAGRECDPDVCRCGVRASVENVRTLGTEQTRLRLLSDSGCECRNCMIQLALGTRLYIGPSEINGWGLFVNERVEKGVFLKEYIGEAISQNEADRRGKVYDRYDTSYLFNVNMHHVLDAMRVGNKSRYANHSKDPNAYAKVVFVNGNQKIGLYAKRLLLPGTEILYNYMHECMDVVPEWQKVMEEAMAARKHVIPLGTDNLKSAKSSRP